MWARSSGLSGVSKMQAVKLAGLEPAAVFGYFEKLCSMPHGSSNTKIISDYLVSFAKEQGLRYIQDDLNNVILFGDASEGYEDHEPVIIQGHMDMVCEKDAGSSINFETDGLDITHDGSYVFANGTTLGGDDGIAVAYALALLSDKTIAHPALEVVITVDEETGMYGAAGIDLSMLRGKKLLNIDSEEEGVFTVSCAGGARANITLPVSRHAVYGPCVKLVVDGLAGGHSGVEIDKGRANANKVMGEFLSEIKKLMPLCLTALEGGSKDNAIPRSCTAKLVAMGMEIERINDVAEALQAKIRAEYNEPDALVYADNVEALGGNALSTTETDKVIGLLCGAPNGIQAMCADMPGLVQTSLNMGVARLSADCFDMTFSVRSSVNQEKLDVLESLKKLAGMYDANYDSRGHYPAWEYKADSVLRDVMVAQYQAMFGADPEVVSIHAGLECGLLGEKIPGLDAVSIGPEMHDIHTSRERLGIASTARMWEFIKAVLKAL